MRIWKRIAAFVAVALVGMESGAEARPTRPAQIPNGNANNCANCHINPAGGGARNIFGQMVEASFLTAAGFSGNVKWGPDLAALDADGDGFTNGEELGDPEGLWKAGDPVPGDPAAVTLPGDPNSHPPEKPQQSAMEASTWAQVKGFVQRLLE